MTTALTSVAPILVASREDGDDAYFEARRGGITATEIRDWPLPSKRRDILKEKVTGDHESRRVRAFDHGNRREPYIAEWAAATHGVVHARGLYAHGENPRYLCTPDGWLGSFSSMQYEPGTDAVTVEVKTTTKDLTPGPLDAARMLVSVDQRSHFHKTRYMRQIQWQMFVMNAAYCLFIWEPYTTEARDPETGHNLVTGPPEWCIIPRDQAMIDRLVEEADGALALIDEARRNNLSGMPPTSDIPTEEAILLNDLFKARESAALAEAARVKAWEALEAYYADLHPEGEFSEPRGFANVSRTIPLGRPVNRFDRDAAGRRAPKKLAEFDAFQARYTVTEPGTPGKPRLSITDQRGKD